MNVFIKHKINWNSQYLFAFLQTFSNSLHKSWEEVREKDKPNGQRLKCLQKAESKHQKSQTRVLRNQDAFKANQQNECSKANPKPRRYLLNRTLNN